MRQCKKTLKAR